MLFNNLFIGLVSLSMIMAHPLTERVQPKIIGRTQPPVVQKRAEIAPEVAALRVGNEQFRSRIAASEPGLLDELTNGVGQTPDFMFIGCSDSRVSEGTIFNARPGTFFTTRNIGNQWSPNDPAAFATLSFAVAALNVRHVIVMGHYGCGGVGNAISTKPEGALDSASGAIQNWIQPLRNLLESSTRPEVVEMRERNKALAVVPLPKAQEPGYRALVEENIKASVAAVAATSVIQNHNVAFKAAADAGNGTVALPLRELFIHGWVYDVENGVIRDLNVSVGPPGVEIPAPSFEAVQAAGANIAKRHAH